jgi:G3E family GTPase
MNLPMAPDAGSRHRTTPVAALLVAGLQAAERERAIRALLVSHPAAARWALIVAGLGMPGVLVVARDAGIETEIVAPGCLCCTGLLPFRVGLTRLLRRTVARPPALLVIEAAFPGHLAKVRAELQRPAFTDLIALDAIVAGVGAHDLSGSTSASAASADAFADLIHSADFLLLDATHGEPHAGVEKARRLKGRLGSDARIAFDANDILQAQRSPNAAAGT